MEKYYAGIQVVITIQNYHIENTVLRSATKSLNIGIIITSIGIALDRIYSSVTTIPVRFAKEGFLIHIEEGLHDLTN